MNIIAVDDERHALTALEKAIKDAVKNASVTCFSTAKDALAYAKEHAVDVAFMDIEMDDMNGLLLAKKLKDIYGDTNIIFVTAYSKYMGDAFDMHASGYVLKPVNPDRVAQELDNLRYPVNYRDKGVYIQCFGNFEIFVDGNPVSFQRSKSKEILAYLVDRNGAAVSNKELAAILWEDECYSRTIQSYLQTLLSDMMKSLKIAGADGIIIKKRGNYAIDVSKVKCDYYQFNEASAKGVNSYHGEYMINYSWAEFTGAYLSNRK